MHYDQNNKCLIHNMFYSLLIWNKCNENLFFLDVSLRMFNNACCISTIGCGALDWWCHFGCDTFSRLWSCKALLMFFIMSIYKAMMMYVALEALMETLGILWKGNWLGMETMLCLLACHEAKVNAWTSMLLIFKLVLPTCYIFSRSFHNIVKRKF
jgi:hypothetical protein